MAAQDHREACGPARHHGDVEPHKQVGLSPLVASRRPRRAERNCLAWKPVAEDHRTGVEGIEGVTSLRKRAHGARGALGLRAVSITFKGVRTHESAHTRACGQRGLLAAQAGPTARGAANYAESVSDVPAPSF